MFDASFPEIVLILLVALIVIGPERLPRLARTLGLWVGKARSMFNTVRDEVEREVQLDELRKAERDLKRDLDMNRDVMAGGGQSANRRPKAPDTERQGKQQARDEERRQPGGGDGPETGS